MHSTIGNALNSNSDIPYEQHSFRDLKLYCFQVNCFGGKSLMK